MTTPQCSNCFFSFIAPADADGPTTIPPRFAGKRYCNRNAPIPLVSAPAAAQWLWPLVEDDYWCGEGADAISGASYALLVNGVPGTGGAGSGYSATSTTSLTIASSGSLAPTTQLNLAYTAGARVRLTSRGTAAWMEGVATNYDALGALTFTADTAFGSGTHADWDINLAGQPGQNGSNAPQWTIANGAPSGGNDGDFWMNTPPTYSPGQTTTVYQKSAGLWTMLGQWVSA